MTSGAVDSGRGLPIRTPLPWNVTGAVKEFSAFGGYEISEGSPCRDPAGYHCNGAYIQLTNHSGFHLPVRYRDHHSCPN